ncbi:hypothetical protein [Pseudomonas inefficax]|uniref:hypothetical protein n=1 Tax=Pseudomonas inefficax TaxID=2078786 RepID=UPI004046FA08
MFTAIDLTGSMDCGVIDCDVHNFDVGVNVSNTLGAKVHGLKFSGRVAVKGKNAPNLSAMDVTHNYLPMPTMLARAIWRSIYGNV